MWFGVVSCILVAVGLIFSFLGFGFFPDFILPKKVLLSWESAIYGSVLIGWGTTLFFLGRMAFRKADTELLKIMLSGISIWLIVEALFSAYLGVFFNVGVDFIVLFLLGFPLLRGILRKKQFHHEPAKSPGDLEIFFLSRANDGDVEGLVALYEPNAVLVTGDGKLVTGTQAIRDFYSDLLSSHPKFTPGVPAPVIQSGDIALTSSSLPNGDTTAEIARRQPDGTWLWTVDQPAIGKV